MFPLFNFLNFELYILNSISLCHMPLIVIDHKTESIPQFQLDQFRNTNSCSGLIQTNLAGFFQQTEHFLLLADEVIYNPFVQLTVQRIHIFESLHFVQLLLWEHAVGKVIPQPATFENRIILPPLEGD